MPTNNVAKVKATEPTSTTVHPDKPQPVPIIEVLIDKKGLINGKKTYTFTRDNVQYKIKKNSSRYKVYYKKGKSWKAIPNKSLAGNSGIYYTIVVNPNKTKTIQIRKGTKTPKAGKVKISSVKTSKKGQLTVKYEKGDRVQGYQVSVSTSKKFEKKNTTTKSLKSSVSSYTFKSLKSKKTYFVKVRAYRMVNEKKVYGSWSNVSKIKVK